MNFIGVFLLYLLFKLIISLFGECILIWFVCVYNIFGLLICLLCCVCVVVLIKLVIEFFFSINRLNNLLLIDVYGVIFLNLFIEWVFVIKNIVIFFCSNFLLYLILIYVGCNDGNILIFFR